MDLTKLPTFVSNEESLEYFQKKGEMEYFGVGGHSIGELYFIYVLRAKDGRRFSVDLFEDGRVRIIKRQSDNT